MKKIISFCLLITAGFSQVYGQEAFRNVAIGTIHNNEVISFSLPREVNIRQYRIEGSNDSINFDVIGAIRSSGNSVLEKSYHYDLAGFSYKYYRVGIVGMNASLQYSALLSTKRQLLHLNPGSSPESLHIESNAISKR